MAHSHVRVVKEALQQIRKANSWIVEALSDEELDEELSDRWEETRDQLVAAFEGYLEASR